MTLRGHFLTLIELIMQSWINNPKEDKMTAKEVSTYKRDYVAIATKCKRQGFVSGETYHELS